MNRELFEESLKEGSIEERFRELSEKIGGFIEKAKILKDANNRLKARVKELEDIVEKQKEVIDNLKNDRLSLRKEIEQILSEIDSLEL